MTKFAGFYLRLTVKLISALPTNTEICTVIKPKSMFYECVLCYFANIAGLDVHLFRMIIWVIYLSSRHQNAKQNRNLMIAYKSFYNAEKFKHLVMTIRIRIAFTKKLEVD